MTAGEGVPGGQGTVPENDGLAVVTAQDGDVLPEDLFNLPDEDEADPKAPDASQAAHPELHASLVETYIEHCSELGRLVLMVTRDASGAEDVVAEVFVETFVHVARGGIQDPEKFLAYLRQAVINRAHSSLRHRRIADEKAARLLQGDKGDSTADEALQTMENEAVWAALKSLPARQRQVLFLRYFYDMSEAQIADTLGIGRGTVKIHASRGMSNLKKLLRAQGISFISHGRL